MKKIPVKEAAGAIAGAEDFKAGDLYGMVWQSDSPLHPVARRIDSMPTDEGDALLRVMKVRQELPKGIAPASHPDALFYIVSSYGVPIAWITHDGTIQRTKMRHSDATAKHIDLALKGLLVLSAKLVGKPS